MGKNSLISAQIASQNIGNTIHSHQVYWRNRALDRALYLLHTGQPLVPPTPYEQEEKAPNFFIHPFKNFKWLSRKGNRLQEIKSFHQEVGQLATDLNAGRITREAAIRYIEAKLATNL